MVWLCYQWVGRDSDCRDAASLLAVAVVLQAVQRLTDDDCIATVKDGRLGLDWLRQTGSMACEA